MAVMMERKVAAYNWLGLLVWFPITTLLSYRRCMRHGGEVEFVGVVAYSCVAVASVELQLQPTDANISFSHPWLDKVERKGGVTRCDHEQITDVRRQQIGCHIVEKLRVPRPSIHG